MTEDRLTELLRGADAAAPLPAVVGLAGRVRRQAHARVRRRQLAAAMVVVVSVGAALWVNRTHRRAEEPAPLASAVSARVSPAVVARLRVEAEIHSTVARALHARQARRRIQTPVTRPTIESERDKAALAMLDHAERLRRDLKEVDAALAAYRRTIELFPGTRWAAVAKQRIEQLKPDARRIEPKHTLT